MITTDSQTSQITSKSIMKMNNELTYVHMRLNKQNEKKEKIIKLENRISLIIYKELFH